jgi:hypothetical protein
MSHGVRLSEKSIAILTLIAEGCSYSQIVDGHPGFSYRDIFAAAEEALRLNEPQSNYDLRMAAIKAKYPRAYEKWTTQEDAELKSMSARGASHDDMAKHFKRQPSAIVSRLEKLGLVHSTHGGRGERYSEQQRRR